ncbi:MAG: DUF503 domain-containing protein [Candidatus Omnitrophica bacterium]|nr:DUF503 domain-containing protein [Candidatus Omnitrophota bacterium]
MYLGVLEVAFHIPEAQSLKQKRKVVLSLKDRIRRRFNVSLAETDGQDAWQRCTLTIARVANQRVAAERDLNRILDLIESEPSILTTDHHIDFY